MKTPAFTAAQASAFRLLRQHLAPRTRTPPPGTAHPAPHPAPRTPHHAGQSVEHICRDTGGIQAQVLSAAEISIWTRARGTTREQIQAALWNDRTIVKTSAMRMTLHLIPAADFPTYIAALRPVQSGIIERVFARFKAKPADVDRVMTAVMDALRDGPQTQQTLVARARERATSAALRGWLKLAWSAVRPLVVDGLVVYGPSRGGEVTFVRTDQWLGRVRKLDLQEARALLLRRFLSAFGPATPRDFSKWTGMRSADAKAAVEALGADVVAVTVDGAHAFANRGDLDAIAAARADAAGIRLLPGFDTLLLAHATKEHLVDGRNFKRVYRPQGWISPVVLRGEQIIAVWFAKPAGARLAVEVRPFAPIDRTTRAAIDGELDALGRFVGRPCDVRYAAKSRSSQD